MNVGRSRIPVVYDEISVPRSNLCAANRSSLQSRLIDEHAARLAKVMVVFKDASGTRRLKMSLANSVLNEVVILRMYFILYKRGCFTMSVSNTVVECRQFEGSSCDK